MQTRQCSRCPGPCAQGHGRQQHLTLHAQLPAKSALAQPQPQRRRQWCQTTAAAGSSLNGATLNGNGAILEAAVPQETARPHSGGLGELASISPVLMQWLLRLAHITCGSAYSAAPAVVHHDDSSLETSAVHIMLRVLPFASSRCIQTGSLPCRADAKPKACTAMSRWSRVPWASACGGCPSLCDHAVTHMPQSSSRANTLCTTPQGWPDQRLERGCCTQAALDKGLILDTETQRQLLLDETYAHMAPVADGLVWPPEPLRSVLICTLVRAVDL